MSDSGDAEQFSEPEPNVITSSTGFSIKVLGRTGMRYTEGERYVWIDSEVLAAPHGIVMAEASVRYWEGPEPDLLSDQERSRIVNNIKRGFAACGYELVVNPPFDWSSVAMRPPGQVRITTQIKISREGGGRFSAKIVPTPWSEAEYWSSGPMEWRDLVAALSARGQHSTDITDAFGAAGVEWPPAEAAL